MQETLYVETPSQTSTHYSRQTKLSNVIDDQQDCEKRCPHFTSKSTHTPPN